VHEEGVFSSGHENVFTYTPPLLPEFEEIIYIAPVEYLEDPTVEKRAVIGQNAKAVQNTINLLAFEEGPCESYYPYVILIGDKWFGYNPYDNGLITYEGERTDHILENLNRFIWDIFELPNVEEDGTLGSR
jgi:hypothetical protein